MNEIERLKSRLHERFPTASLAMDPAETPSGSWWLDVELQGHHVAVKWRPEVGFGISTASDDDFDSGADEIYTSESAALDRVKELLRGRLRTVPPRELTLPKLRETRELSQVELAGRLQVSQGALSRMERRSDMLIGSLRSAIAAMGGELEVRASFPEGDVVRIKFDEGA
jgi:DNA-binding transcriptional regulator YiaG